MREEIIQTLNSIAEEKQIRVLYAVESGSRAWGFPSKNSDWDVRFLYIHKPEWYFRIDKESDNTVEMLPNDIDITGWELRKALGLFRKSNPPLLEWLRSPIVYQQKGKTVERMRSLIDLYFNRKVCLNHYYNVALTKFGQYADNESISLKKFFYVIRTLLACGWLIERETPVPVEFGKLLADQVKEDIIKDEIEKLRELKANGEETDEVKKNHLLHEYLSGMIDSFRMKIMTVESKPPHDTEPLNDLFREAVYEEWD